MLRNLLCLSLCAILSANSLAQAPKQPSPAEVKASLDAISKIAKDRVTELQKSSRKIRDLFRDADKREQFKLIHASLYHDVVDVKTHLSIIEAVENQTDKSNVTLIFAQLWSQSFADFPARCERLNGLRLLGTAADTNAATDNDPLNDVISEIMQVQKELTPHIEKLKRIKAKQPAIARGLPVQ